MDRTMISMATARAVAHDEDLLAALNDILGKPDRLDPTDVPEMASLVEMGVRGQCDGLWFPPEYPGELCNLFVSILEDGLDFVGWRFVACVIVGVRCIIQDPPPEPPVKGFKTSQTHRAYRTLTQSDVLRSEFQEIVEEVKFKGSMEGWNRKKTVDVIADRIGARFAAMIFAIQDRNPPTCFQVLLRTFFSTVAVREIANRLYSDFV